MWCNMNINSIQLVYPNSPNCRKFKCRGTEAKASRRADEWVGGCLKECSSTTSIRRGSAGASKSIRFHIYSMNSFGFRLRFPLIVPHCTIRKCYSQIPEQSPTVPNYPDDFSILHANGTIEAHLGEVQGRQWDTLTRTAEPRQMRAERENRWLETELTQVKLNQLVHMPCLAWKPNENS